MNSLKKLLKKTQKEFRRLIKASLPKEAMGSHAGIRLRTNNIKEIFGEQAIKIKNLYRKLLGDDSYFRWRVVIPRGDMPPAAEGELRPGYDSILKQVENPDALSNAIGYLTQREKNKSVEKKFFGYCEKCGAQRETDWVESNKEGEFVPFCPVDSRHGVLNDPQESNTNIKYPIKDDIATASLFKWINYEVPGRGFFVSVPVNFKNEAKRPIAFNYVNVANDVVAEMDNREAAGQDPKLSYSEIIQLATNHAYYTYGRQAYDDETGLPLANVECPGVYDGDKPVDRLKDFMLDTTCAKNAVIPLLTPRESPKTREYTEVSKRYKKTKKMYDSEGNEVVPQTVDDVVMYGDAYFPLREDHEVLPQAYQMNRRTTFPSLVSRGTSAKRGNEFDYNASVAPEFRLGSDMPVEVNIGSANYKKMKAKHPDLVTAAEFREPFIEEAKNIVASNGGNPDKDTTAVDAVATRLSLDAEAAEAQQANRPSLRQKINMFSDFLQERMKNLTPDDVRKKRPRSHGESVPFEERDPSFAFTIDTNGDWKKSPSTPKYVFEENVPIPNKVLDIIVSPEFVPYRDSKGNVRNRKFYFAGWSEVKEGTSIASSPITVTSRDFNPEDAEGMAKFREIIRNDSKGRGYFTTLNDAFQVVQKNFCVDMTDPYNERNSGIRPSDERLVFFDPDTNAFQLRTNYDGRSLERAQAAFVAFASMTTEEFEQYRREHPDVVQRFLPGLREDENLVETEEEPVIPTHNPVNIPNTDSGDDRGLVDTLSGALQNLGIASEDVQEITDVEQQRAAVQNSARELRESMEEAVATGGDATGDDLIETALHNTRVREFGEEGAREIEESMAESEQEADEILRERSETEDPQERKPYNTLPVDSPEDITTYIPDITNEEAFGDFEEKVDADINVVTVEETEELVVDQMADEAESMQDIEEEVEEFGLPSVLPTEEEVAPEVTPEVTPEEEEEVLGLPSVLPQETATEPVEEVQEEVEEEEALNLPSVLPKAPQTPATPEVEEWGQIEQDFQEVPQEEEEDEEEVIGLPDVTRKPEKKSDVVEELVKMAEKYDREGKFGVSKKIDAAIEKIVGKKIKY